MEAPLLQMPLALRLYQGTATPLLSGLPSPADAELRVTALPRLLLILLPAADLPLHAALVRLQSLMTPCRLKPVHLGPAKYVQKPQEPAEKQLQAKLHQWAANASALSLSHSLSVCVQEGERDTEREGEWGGKRERERER